MLMQTSAKLSAAMVNSDHGLRTAAGIISGRTILDNIYMKTACLPMPTRADCCSTWQMRPPSISHGWTCRPLRRMRLYSITRTLYTDLKSTILFSGQEVATLVATSGFNKKVARSAGVSLRSALTS